MAGTRLYNPGMLLDEKKCKDCGVSRDQRILTRCPICHESICRNCGFRRQGQAIL